jgi:hypothetical protein
MDHATALARATEETHTGTRCGAGSSGPGIQLTGHGARDAR